MATFGTRMREARKNKGFTLEDLSEKLNTTKATLSRYENDKRFPDIYVAKEIADALEIDLNFLAYGKDKPNNEEIQTIAAHFDGEDYTEEEKEDIDNFIKNFVIRKREEKK